jgi:hypothetical protein
MVRPAGHHDSRDSSHAKKTYPRPSEKSTVLLCVPGTEPKVGKDWTGPEEGTVVREGQWRYEKAPCVTVTHEYKPAESHGRAFLKVLHPDSLAILKIGGGKHFADALDGKSAAADQNYSTFATRLDAPKQIAAGGYWRFHLVPEAPAGTTPAGACSFLTAIEAADSKQPKPSGAMELLPSEEFLAARLGPNLVLFSRSGGVLEAGSVKIAAEGLRRVVLADLRPETEYQVKLAGKEVSTAKTTSAGTVSIKRAAWPTAELLEVRRK